VERFEAVIEPGRGGGAFVVLPPSVWEALGATARMRVRGTLAGVPYRSSVMPMGGGQYALGVHKATRESAGVSVGDTVAVEAERDDEPRDVEVPPELAAALAADPVAQSAFDALAPTHRNEYARWVGEAKRDETRARRAAQAVERLLGP
jgi:hypothetical protein